MHTTTEQTLKTDNLIQDDIAFQANRQVDVRSIRHYPGNPRRKSNPEYQRIKASIRYAGLDQPLIITQEPGKQDYVLHSGGNTRLQILQELFAETSEVRYRLVDCVFRPWDGESSVLFAHLRENELRGGLPFIDKALAVFSVKAMLEKELAVESLSLRQLEQLFRDRGFSLSHTMISKMGYAVTTLWPVMHEALSAGLGRPQVERIRALARATSELWSYLGIGEQEEFDAVFAELCRRHDCAEWDTQILAAALENELAVESERSQHVIHLALEAQLAGKPFDHFLPRESEVMAEERPITEKVKLNIQPKKQAVYADRPKLNNRSNSNQVAEAEVMTKLPTQKTAYHKLATDELILENDEIRIMDDESDLSSLRHRHWLCARQLAEQYNLSERVIQVPELGLGFLLHDVPPLALTEPDGTDMPLMVSALWWQLAACSAIAEAPTDAVLHYIERNSILYKALSAHNVELLIDSIEPPNAFWMTSKFWQQLSPPDWQLYLRMLETCRSIKRQAVEYDVKLWLPGG